MDETDASSAAVCKFCAEKRTGRYTCPRCNARYCSVDCYKAPAHLACSELFYRDCFMEGLRTMQPESSSERSKLMDMLQRLELDSDETDDLTQRFTDVNIDSCSTELIWQRLTASERAEFEKFVNSGKACHLVELWEPWWCASSQGLVEEVGQECRASKGLPPVLLGIMDIKQLAKCGSSGLIPFSIINVLYAYAYVARLYNGEHLTMAGESATVMLDIAECLRRGVFTDVSLALGGCLSRLDGPLARSHFISREYSISIVDDVCKLVAGATTNPVSYPLAALSDCHSVFHTARKEASQEQKKNSDVDRKRVDNERKQYFAVEKKLEYFVSWTLSHGHTLLQWLPSLELTSCELSTELAVHCSHQARVEEIIERKKTETQPVPLIEELSSGC